MAAATGLFACLLVAALVAWGVYAVVRRSLRSLLDGVVRRSAATQFYLRVFAICIAFAALSGALDNRWDPSGKPAFMEQVWVAASTLSAVIRYVLVVLVCFAIIFSILVASLGRRPAEPAVCLKCGYNLKGVIDEVRCPECGERFVGADSS